MDKNETGKAVEVRNKRGREEWLKELKKSLTTDDSNCVVKEQRGTSIGCKVFL